MPADLSLQQSPPFSVPARFLASAPLFGLAAALVMLWQGPEMITHRWTPGLLAVTHFLTLGFLAMSMLGALMQLIPVLMGTMIPHAVLFSRLVHLPLFLGTACLGIAWLNSMKTFFIIAMVLLGFSFGLFIIVAIERLLRSKNTHVTRSMMLLALLALSITVGLGFYLAMGYTWPAFPLARHLTDLHLSWGLLAWVGLLIMAVAYQVIPMFQITDEYPAIHQRWMGWLLFITIIIMSLAYGWQLEALKTITTLILCNCFLIFSLTTLWVLHTRKRKIPDLTMKFWQLAMISLATLTLIWLLSTLFGFKPPVLLFGVLAIHGFAITTVTGMTYKIIPFIIWLHLSARNKILRDEGMRESQVKVPHMRKIIPEAAGFWQFRIHLVSLIALSLTSIWPALFYYPAALTFAISQVLLLLNLLKAASFYNTKLTKLNS